MSAEWLDGSRQFVDLNGKSPAEISETFKLLSAQATAEEMIYRPKLTSTQMPSIQGYNFHCLIEKKPLKLTELPGMSLSFINIHVQRPRLKGQRTLLGQSFLNTLTSFIFRYTKSGALYKF